MSDTSMGITKKGRYFIAKAIVNQAETYFDEENAHIGVGNGTIPFNSEQEDLQGNNKYRSGMEADYPIVENNRITFKASFGEDIALFDWNEWGVFNAKVGGIMLFRKVESRGTKVLAIWNFTVTLEVVEEEDIA